MLRKLLMTFLFMAFSATYILAQNGAVEGTVTDNNDETIPGANVLLVESEQGTSTGVDGNYSIDNVEPGTYTLRVTFVGFSTFNEEITVESGETAELDVQLSTDTFGLDEVVVTGVISGTPQKKLAFTVGEVSGDALSRVSSADPSSALQGKMAGVKVVNQGGSPGEAASIRLRGSTSIGGATGGDQEPLIIVDGVILDGTLADIPSSDIESMEVLKGASAASLYGSRAANGVIQIFTKRGSNLDVGSTSVTIRNEYGRSWLGKRLDLAESHSYARTDEELANSGANPADYEMDPTGSYMINDEGSRVGVVDQIADNEYGTYNDQLDQVYQQGVNFENYLNISRNLGDGNYSLSFTNTDENGVVDLKDGYNRQNVRLNIDQEISDQLDVSASGSYSQSTNDVVTEGPSSPFWGVLYMQPNYNLNEENEEDGSMYNVNADPYTTEDNPLYNLNQIDRERDRNRFLGNAQLRYRPTETILIEGNYSIDRANQMYEVYTPKGILSNNDGFTTEDDDGSLERTTFDNTSQNLNLTAGYDNRFGDVNVGVKASYLYESSNYQSFGATGNDFAIGDIISWDAIMEDGNRTLDNYTEKVRSENIFGIVALDYKDRYIFDLLVRRDGSSLFGEDERYNNYFRSSVAYRISEDFDIPGINEFKVRASYGTAGRRPPFEAQYLTYNINSGNTSKNTLGNPELTPALAKELELGTNIEFFGRFSFSGSYSSTSVEDQILSVPLGAKAGGFNSRWENAGTLESTTIEAQLDAQAIQGSDMSLRFGINFDKTTQEITELDVAPYFQGPDQQAASVFYVDEGINYGSMYGNVWLKSLDNLSEAQQNSGTEYAVNSDGYVVTDIGTTSESPVQKEDEDGNNVFKMGDVNPDFNVGLSTTFDYKGFGVYALFDAQIGGDVYNQTRAWLYRDARHGDVDQAGKAADEKKSEGYYRAFYNANNPSSYFVEDASYLKLRELSFSYRFTNEQLGALGGNFLESVNLSLTGRNLITLTGYSGYDPEVSGVGGDVTNFAFDGFSYPNFKSVSGSIELRF